MNDSRTLHTLMLKLATLRDELKTTAAIGTPPRVARHELEGYLRFSQAEMVEIFREKSARNLPQTLRIAIIVLARIHEGRDNYGTIMLSAERLIKSMHPLYLGRLKRHERMVQECAEYAERMALENTLSELLPGKALPPGMTIAGLREIISELQAA